MLMPDKSSTHTPEPWDTQADPDIDDSTIYVHTIEGDDAPVLVATFPWHDTGEANAARIVRCVNACAGIPDPAAELADLRELPKAWQRVSVLQDELLGCYRTGRQPGLLLDYLKEAHAALAKLEAGS